MNRSLILLVVLSLCSAQCAMRTAGPPALPAPASPVQDSPEMLHRFVDRLPIGSTLMIHLASGRRMSAVLMGVGPTGVVVKWKTRVPEPAATLPFETIITIEPAGNGPNLVRAAVIGAAVGAGVFLSLLLVVLAHAD